MTESNVFKYLYATDLDGDPSDEGGHGWAGVAVRTDTVDVSLPHPNGHNVEFTLTRADWDKVLEMFIAATEDDGSKEPLQFAPGDDDKWRPKNATVHQLRDGTPAITAWVE